MEKRVLVEVGVQGLTLRKEVPDAWFGGNPIYHAKEASAAAHKVVDELDALIAAHFGDIRTREDQPGAGTLEPRNIRVQDELWARATEKAALEGTNVSAVIRRLLKAWVA